MLVFNVRLHGDIENDHKNANGLQSEAFQKRIGNGLRVNAKKQENVACNCKQSCDNRIFLPFLCLHEWRPTQKGHENSYNLPRPRITAFCLGSRLVHRIL